MEVTYDKYGYCVLCHRNLRYEQVINDKVMMRFDTDYDETEYLLDDGSKMRVAICKPCKEKLTEEHNIEVMDSVKAGWVEEVKTLPWTEEKKQNYIDTYSQKEIVCFSDGVPEDVLKKAHADYQLAKVTPIDIKPIEVDIKKVGN